MINEVTKDAPPHLTNNFLPTKRGFKMASLNISSLTKHIDELRILLANYPLDVISINGTRLEQGIEYVHGGHIGGPKQKNDIPLGNKCYLYANIFNCFGPPTWPPCTYSILGFPSHDQQPCFSTKTKQDVSIIIAFNSRRIGLEHQHGRHFIVWGHQHGGRDVM